MLDYEYNKEPPKIVQVTITARILYAPVSCGKCYCAQEQTFYIV